MGRVYIGVEKMLVDGLYSYSQQGQIIGSVTIKEEVGWFSFAEPGTEEPEDNLERVLGVEFPSRTDSAKEDWSVECGICYSYRLGDQLPTKTCDDSRCCQPFHLTCLYEWLVNLPGARTTLSLVHGECPYCSKPMQCPRPSE